MKTGLVGSKLVRNSLSEPVHTCAVCDFPISIYGRLSDCNHVFCIACAKASSTCATCNKQVKSVTEVGPRVTVYKCLHPGCMRGYLSKSSLTEHQWLRQHQEPIPQILTVPHQLFLQEQIQQQLQQQQQQQLLQQQELVNALQLQAQLQQYQTPQYLLNASQQQFGSVQGQQQQPPAFQPMEVIPSQPLSQYVSASQYPQQRGDYQRNSESRRQSGYSKRDRR